MAWQTPKKNWNSGNVVLPTDLNRIEGNIDELNNVKLDKTGDVKDATVTFADTNSDGTITSGSKLSALISLIKYKLNSLNTTLGQIADGTITLGDARSIQGKDLNGLKNLFQTNDSYTGTNQFLVSGPSNQLYAISIPVNAKRGLGIIGDSFRYKIFVIFNKNENGAFMFQHISAYNELSCRRSGATIYSSTNASVRLEKIYMEGQQIKMQIDSTLIAGTEQDVKINWEVW